MRNSIWYCIVPIGELLVFGVAFSCCIFLTALSILGGEILELKVVGMCGLLGEVTMKLFLLSDVFTLGGLFCVEPDVRVLTSIVGELIIPSLLMRMRACSVVSPCGVLNAAVRMHSTLLGTFHLGFFLYSRFPESFGFVSFWGIVCCFCRRADNCCFGCCFFVVVSRLS